MRRHVPEPSKHRRTTLQRQVQNALGDESCTTDDTSDDFQSVSTDVGATNYGLNFTGRSTRSSTTPGKTPTRSSLQRSPTRPAATRSTSKHSPSKRTSRPVEAEALVQSKRRTTNDPDSRHFKLPAAAKKLPPKGKQSALSHSHASTSRYREDEEEEDQHDQSSRGKAATTTAPARERSPDKSRRRKQKTPIKKNKIDREINYLRASTKNQIAKLPFSRLIRELLLYYSPEGMRITMPALEALQESAELYLTQLFEDAYRCTIHRQRVTLLVKDMELVRYLRGPMDPGNV